MALWKRLAILNAAVLLFCVAFGLSQAPKQPTKPKPTKELLALGKELYGQKCAICHGEKGDGNGDAAYLLYPRPRDFTQAVFKIRSTPSGTLPTDEDLFRTVSEGMAGTAMVPWKGELSEREIWALVYHIKTFSQRWRTEKPGTPVPIGTPPPPTPQLITLGRKVYEKMQCGQCHGEKGRGDGPSAATLKDQWGMPIIPYDFTLPGRFKGGGKPRDIIRTFTTGMDGTPMPSYGEGVLKEKERWALAYYTLSLAVPKPERPSVGNRIVAQRYEGELPLDPLHPAWLKAPHTEIPLRLLWLRRKSVETVRTRALFNERQIAIMVVWDDPMVNGSFLKSEDFRDAVAVQFPLQREGKPFFGMGDRDRPVRIWHWKADWQREVVKRQDVDITYPNMAVDFYPDESLFITGLAVGNLFSLPKTSPVEELNATGQGTVTPLPKEAQRVEGNGIWAMGKWWVVFRRALGTEDPYDVQFRIGDRIPIAFAVWDGDAGDRGGQKAVTTWQVLEIGKVR